MLARGSVPSFTNIISFNLHNIPVKKILHFTDEDIEIQKLKQLDPIHKTSKWQI